MRKLGHRQPARPIVLLVVSHEPQERFDPLVRSLRLAIRPGMVGRRYVLFDSY